MGPMGTADASTSSMLATEHHLFVLRDGVLYQFDVHSLKLLRSHRFDGELTTAKVAEVPAATKPAANAPALPAAPTQAEMQASVDGVSFNPFTLRLELLDLRITEMNGVPLGSVQRIVADAADRRSLRK